MSSTPSINCLHTKVHIHHDHIAYGNLGREVWPTTPDYRARTKTGIPTVLLNDNLIGWTHPHDLHIWSTWDL